MKSVALVSFSLSLLSFNALSGSYIEVHNHSLVPIQAIWQAGGCGDVERDVTNDYQFTVCDSRFIFPKQKLRYNFNLFHSDRSVKVFAEGYESRIAYCNSMDDSSLTISQDEEGNFKIKSDC